MKIHVNEAKQAFPINSSFKAWFGSTPAGLVTEVTLLGEGGKEMDVGASFVAAPLTEKKVADALRHAAIKAIHAYINGELVAPDKDDGKSIKSATDRLSEASRMLTDDRHFNGVAADILEKVQGSKGVKAENYVSIRDYAKAHDLDPNAFLDQCQRTLYNTGATLDTRYWIDNLDRALYWMKRK